MYQSQPLKFRVYHKNKSIKKFSKIFEIKEYKTSKLKLIAQTFGYLSIKQFVMARNIILKNIKKSGKLIFFGFPNLPLSKRKEVVRMGKGKGAQVNWVFAVKPGFLFCEISFSNFNKSLLGLKALQHRLPIKTKIIYN